MRTPCGVTMMDVSTWLLLGNFLFLVAIFALLLRWYGHWRQVVRDDRDQDQALKKLLLANFSDIVEAVGMLNRDKGRDARAEPAAPDDGSPSSTERE